MTKQKVFFAGFSVLSLLAVATAFVPAPNAAVLKKVSSPYNGELTVVDEQLHGTRFLLAQSRQGLVVQSTINLLHKQELTMGYFQVMALLTAMHPSPTHIFNLGLGGGALPRFHLAKYSKSEVISAEIDSAVIDLAKRYFSVADQRHRILEGDGFEVLKEQPAKFDVVWVDTVTPKEGPKAFIQAKNLNVLRDHLNESGLIVANLGDSKNPENFSGVERSYRQGYLHGIRVKSPLPLHDETPDAILALVTEGSKERVPELIPSYFVAVGNQDTLNCATFWKLYQNWKSAKTISIGWGSVAADSGKVDGICKDL